MDPLNALYSERNRCVALLMAMAISLGYKTGMGIDEKETPEWQHVAFIDLPTGQVSWHIAPDDLPLFEDFPYYEGEWDGHDTDMKNDRLKLQIYLVTNQFYRPLLSQLEQPEEKD